MHLKLKYLVLIITIPVLPLKSQQLAIVRSALGAGGSSAISTVSPGRASLQQSIGQNSVTGVFRHNELELRQGFIQSVKSLSYLRDQEERKINIWPNPFTDFIFINLNNESQGSTDMSVSSADIAGKVAFSGRIPAGGTSTVRPGSLAKGIYILKIKTGRLQVYRKIIKN